MRRNGFTVVELVITMAIMAILLGLAVVSLISTQANGRDAERKSDIETIARGIEQRYSRGFAIPSDGSGQPTSATLPSPISLNEGSYPSTQEMSYLMGSANSNFSPATLLNKNFITDNLPGTDLSSFSAPNNGNLIVSSSRNTPNVSTLGNNYMYTPLNAAKKLCTNINTTCASFTLYYVSEVGGTVQAIGSRHQQ